MLLFCFDLDNMFIIYTIITYTLQDQDIKQIMYMYKSYIIVYIQLVDLCSTQKQETRKYPYRTEDEKHIN